MGADALQYKITATNSDTIDHSLVSVNTATPYFEPISTATLTGSSPITFYIYAYNSLKTYYSSQIAINIVCTPA